MNKIAFLYGAQTRRLKKIIHKTRDRDLCRRANAVLLVLKGKTKSEVASLLQAGRSSLNRWLKWYDVAGVDGLKTGYTKEAGYCLVTTAQRDGQRIIGVLMKETAPKTRNEEMCSLLDYGFNNYKQVTIFKKDTLIEQHLVDKMDNLTIDVKCKKDIVYTKAKSADAKVSTKVNYKENLLPVKQGDVIGTLDVIVDGKTIATYDVYSDTNASKSTYLSKTIKTLKYLF